MRIGHSKGTLGFKSTKLIKEKIDEKNLDIKKDGEYPKYITFSVPHHRNYTQFITAKVFYYYSIIIVNKIIFRGPLVHLLPLNHERKHTYLT